MDLFLLAKFVNQNMKSGSYNKCIPDTSLPRCVCKKKECFAVWACVKKVKKGVSKCAKKDKQSVISKK